MIDSKTLSIAEMIFMIRPTKSAGIKVIGQLLVRVIALERQKMMFLAVFSQYLEICNR